MAFCQLLIAVIWYLKILPIREESESLFCFINTYLVLSLIKEKKPRKFHGVLLAKS